MADDQNPDAEALAPSRSPDAQEVLSHLKRKGVRSNCPSCQHVPMTLLCHKDDEKVAWLVAFVMSDPDGQLTFPGPVLPSVLLFCPKCGHQQPYWLSFLKRDFDNGDDQSAP